MVCIIQPNDTFVQYSLRYISKPSEIDLNDSDKDCKLPEILHQEILQRAVELAKLSWDGNINAVVAAGQNSE